MPRILKLTLVVLVALLPVAVAVPAVSATTAPTYRILVIGDSISQDLGAALQDQLSSSPRVTIENAGRPSSGLSNSWFYDWPSQLEQFLITDHPQLIVMLLGANDVRGMAVDNHSAAFLSPAWRTQYTTYVDLMMAEATATGAKLLWLGAPVMHVPTYSQGLAHLNTIFATQAATHPGVTFVPTWNVLTSSPGHFQFATRVNGHFSHIRLGDGIHPTTLGSSVLATYVIGKIHHLYAYPVRASAPATVTH